MSMFARSFPAVVVALACLAVGCYPAASESVRRDMVRAQAAKQTGCAADALAVTHDKDFAYRAQGCGWDTYYTISCPGTGCVATLQTMSRFEPAAAGLPAGVVRGHRVVDVRSQPHAPDVPWDLRKSDDLQAGVFRLCISEEGKVYDVSVVQGTGQPALDDSWIAALKTWRYTPYTRDGKPVRACRVERLVSMAASDRGLDVKEIQRRLSRSQLSPASLEEVVDPPGPAPAPPPGAPPPSAATAP